MRELHAFREQLGLRQEASAERAAAELLGEEEVAAPKTKKAKQTLVVCTVYEMAAACLGRKRKYRAHENQRLHVRDM